MADLAPMELIFGGINLDTTIYNATGLDFPSWCSKSPISSTSWNGWSREVKAFRQVDCWFLTVASHKWAMRTARFSTGNLVVVDDQIKFWRVSYTSATPDRKEEYYRCLRRVLKSNGFLGSQGNIPFDMDHFLSLLGYLCHGLVSQANPQQLQANPYPLWAQNFCYTRRSPLVKVYSFKGGLYKNTNQSYFDFIRNCVEHMIGELVNRKGKIVFFSYDGMDNILTSEFPKNFTLLQAELHRKRLLKLYRFPRIRR